MGGRLGDLPDLLASLPSLGDDAADFAADIDRAREELGDRARQEPDEPAALAPTPSSRATSARASARP